MKVIKKRTVFEELFEWFSSRICRLQTFGKYGCTVSSQHGRRGSSNRICRLCHHIDTHSPSNPAERQLRSATSRLSHKLGIFTGKSSSFPAGKNGAYILLTFVAFAVPLFVWCLGGIGGGRGPSPLCWGNALSESLSPWGQTVCNSAGWFLLRNQRESEERWEGIYGKRMGRSICM